MPNSILIIDDDATFRSILSEIFSDYEVYTAANGKEGLVAAKAHSPDIILLDIVMGEMDGYEFCESFKANEEGKATPIIFLSSLASEDSRLKAYDLGGSDYINKSCSEKEILTKVEIILNSEREHSAIKDEIETRNSILLNLQRETSQMQVVTKFLKASQYCHSIDTLVTVLFNCLRKLQTRGVLYIKSEDKVISSSSTNATKLEEEILKNYDDFGRIYSFGAGRAVFNWRSMSLLIKDVDGLIDIVAHLMDAVESSMRAILSHQKLVEQVIRVEQENAELRKKLSESAQYTGQSLKEQLIATGIMDPFDLQDEEAFERIMESRGEDLHSFMASMNHDPSKIHDLLNQLQTPPEDFKDLFENYIPQSGKPNDASDEILF